MNLRTCGALALLLATAILGGCAATRSEVKVAAPTVTTATVTKQKAVVIRSVRDERMFQATPSDPSTPSLGSDGSSDAVKARAIARKRNGYGQAMGDVLLQDGQSVTGLVRDNLAAAFRQAGYRVAPDLASAGASPLVVDVTIRKFWSWLTPGFSAITVRSHLETDVQVSGMAGTTTITANTTEPHMFVSDDVWVQVVDKMLATYRAQATGKLENARF